MISRNSQNADKYKGIHIETCMEEIYPARVRLAFYLYQNNAIYALVNNNSGMSKVNHKHFTNQEEIRLLK